MSRIMRFAMSAEEAMATIVSPSFSAAILQVPIPSTPAPVSVDTRQPRIRLGVLGAAFR